MKSSRFIEKVNAKVSILSDLLVFFSLARLSLVTCGNYQISLSCPVAMWVGVHTFGNKKFLVSSIKASQTQVADVAFFIFARCELSIEYPEIV